MIIPRDSLTKMHGGRRLALAILVLITISFQTFITVETLQSFFANPSASTPETWVLVFLLRVLTAWACLGLGFYVAALKSDDNRAWLLLAALVSFSVNVDGTDIYR